MAPRASCRHKAVELLARRPHFRLQLRQKLVDRGYPEEEIVETLDHLETLGYLDDHRSAMDFVRSRLERGPVGRRRLRAELERRGAPEDAVDEALDALVERDDRPVARRAAARWLARRPAARDPARERAALARHLDRQGFSRGAVAAVVTEIDWESGA